MKVYKQILVLTSVTTFMFGCASETESARNNSVSVPAADQPVDPANPIVPIGPKSEDSVQQQQVIDSLKTFLGMYRPVLAADEECLDSMRAPTPGKKVFQGWTCWVQFGADGVAQMNHGDTQQRYDFEIKDRKVLLKYDSSKTYGPTYENNTITTYEFELSEDGSSLKEIQKDITYVNKRVPSQVFDSATKSIYRKVEK